MNIFQYASMEELRFDCMASENGYKRISTFFSDLSIAEVYGASAVSETYRNVVASWKNDYKMFTEFVLCLNWKSWEWYETPNKLGLSEDETRAMSEHYVTLYEMATEVFYKTYENNEEANDYFYRVTD